jgi:hypothetical protein
MLATFIAALALSMPLAAQDEAPAEAAAPPADAPPAEAPPVATPPAETPPVEPAGAAEARRAATAEDNDFVPTQDIEPDEEVIFPVNF